MTKTYTAAQRKEQLIDIGAKLGAKLGIVNVQRQLVADKAGCAHSLVSVYLGDAKSAQAAYRKRMKKLGLTEPSKEKIEAIGIEARKHKVKTARDTRKRSPKEVEAIKRKRATAALPAKKSIGSPATAGAAGARTRGTTTAPTVASSRETKPAVAPKIDKPAPKSAPSPKPQHAPAPQLSERKTAARKPLPPPPLAARPVDPVDISPVLAGYFP